MGARVLSACTPRDMVKAPADGPLDAARFTAMRRFKSLSMGNVAFVEQGAGRAVLLLHGFPLNSFQWRGAIQRLAPDARCIAPDFLGMGHSAAAAGQDVGPAAQAEMLVALLDALAIERADLIANDSGCAVAQLLMVRYPARVRSVLLTNGDTEMQCPPEAMKSVIELARQGRFVDEWLAPWHADPNLARSEKGLGGLCYADRGHPTDDALRMYFGPLMDSAERKAALHAYAVALDGNVLARHRAGLACEPRAGAGSLGNGRHDFRGRKSRVPRTQSRQLARGAASAGRQVVLAGGTSGHHRRAGANSLATRAGLNPRDLQIAPLELLHQIVTSTAPPAP